MWGGGAIYKVLGIKVAGLFNHTVIRIGRSIWCNFKEELKLFYLEPVLAKSDIFLCSYTWVTHFYGSNKSYHSNIFYTRVPELILYHMEVGNYLLERKRAGE